MSLRRAVATLVHHAEVDAAHAVAALAAALRVGHRPRDVAHHVDACQVQRAELAARMRRARVARVLIQIERVRGVALYARPGLVHQPTCAQPSARTAVARALIQLERVFGVGRAGLRLAQSVAEHDATRELAALAAGAQRVVALVVHRAELGRGFCASGEGAMSPDGAAGTSRRRLVPLALALPSPRPSSCRASPPQPSNKHPSHAAALDTATHRRAITRAIVARFACAAQASSHCSVVGRRRTLSSACFLSSLGLSSPFDLEY